MERLIILNPYDTSHIKLLMNYEKEKNVSTKSLETVLKVRETLTENEFQELRKKSNDLEMSLLIEDSGKVKDLCLLQGEKDRKICKLFFTPVAPKTKSRKLLSLATEFALNNLNMESVFVITDESDKVMHASLEEKGFECLGLEKDSIIYLKEPELELEHKNINSI